MFTVRATILCVALLPVADASTCADELPNLSRVIECKLIREEVERLHCYDRALSEAPANAPSRVTPDVAGAASFAEGGWFVSLGNSPADDIPQLVAVLEALGGRAALVFRCQQGRTDVYLTLQTYVGAALPLPVTYAVNGGEEIAARWLPAKDGNALFVPTPTSAVEFIRSLPDQATLALTIHDFIGRGELLRFKMGPVADLRDKMAGICNWPAQQPQVGNPATAHQTEAVGKIAYVPLSHHRWSVSVRHPQREN
jgi:hypothetical protein